jgi:hypothetical protein
MRDDEYDRDDEPLPPRRKSGGGMSALIIVLIVLLVGGVLVLPIAACLIGLLLPAVQKVREAALKAKSQNDMRQIGLALYNYQSMYNQFPAPYSTTRDGKPGLSWRVEILPFLGEPQYDALYKQFDLKEAWDSPKNLSLIAQMPKIYGPPGSSETNIRVFVGGGAAFEPGKKMKITDFADGMSDTILAIEAAGAVPWTKPDELNCDPKAPLPALGGPSRDTVMVLMADGSVKNIRKTAPAAGWHAAITRAGGEMLGPEWQ